MNFRERRRHPRTQCDRTLVVGVGEGRTARNVVGRVLDVSEGGVRVMLPEALPRGSRVELILLAAETSPSEEALSAEAQIAWAETTPDAFRRYQHGVAFLNSASRLVRALLAINQPPA